MMNSIFKKNWEFVSGLSREASQLSWVWFFDLTFKVKILFLRNSWSVKSLLDIYPIRLIMISKRQRTTE